MKRKKTQIGVFIKLAEPTKSMLTEAVNESFYESLYGKYPRVQILTIQELLKGQAAKYPAD